MPQPGRACNGRDARPTRMAIVLRVSADCWSSTRTSAVPTPSSVLSSKPSTASIATRRRWSRASGKQRSKIDRSCLLPACWRIRRRAWAAAGSLLRIATRRAATRPPSGVRKNTANSPGSASDNDAIVARRSIASPASFSGGRVDHATLTMKCAPRSAMRPSGPR